MKVLQIPVMIPVKNILKKILRIMRRFIMLYSVSIKNVKLWNFLILLLLQNGKIRTIFLLWMNIYNRERKISKISLTILDQLLLIWVVFFVLKNRTKRRNIDESGKSFFHEQPQVIVVKESWIISR